LEKLDDPKEFIVAYDKEKKAKVVAYIPLAVFSRRTAFPGLG
jgi:hypothetical protein